MIDGDGVPIGLPFTSGGFGPRTMMVTPVVTVPTVTNAVGDAGMSIALTDPALVGGQLRAQWLVAGSGGCVSLASFPDAFWIQIE